MILWQPGVQWLDEHTSSDLVYTVVVAFDSRESRDAVLREAARGRLSDGDAVLHGGAALEPRGEREVLATSGGEDALDSLEGALNDTLGGAIERLGITAVELLQQERRLER
ncbi:hypothetical protein [Luteococcus sp.]|uniref:hypothetical protein n=1 Tax=Luteococcus sp. TaxID=1969402 RepID=UPI003736F28F